MGLGAINRLQEPLGRGMPLPGGPTIDMPQARATGPSGAPGGLGNMTPAATRRPLPAGGTGDMPSFADSRKTLMEHHNRMNTWYDATGKALKQVDLIRKSLEKLSDKQDMVTMDDIVQEAGKLVSHGIDPMALAGILADAPQEGGGEALGGWVASHAQAAMQGEQMLIQQHNLARYHMGNSALHLLMAHDNANAMQPEGQQIPMDQGNQLDQSTGKRPGEAPTPGDYSPSNALATGGRFLDKGGPLEDKGPPQGGTLGA